VLQLTFIDGYIMNNPHSTLHSGKIFRDSIHHSERQTLSSIGGSVIEELSSKLSSPGLATGDLDVTADLTQLSDLSVSTVQTLTAVSLDGQRLADNGSGGQALALALQPLVAIGNRSLGAIPSSAGNEVNQDHHAGPNSTG
jgi:hypothetical protein